MKIAILLSTYNGAKFLESQLISLIEQTNNNWTLYIRDDGSTDDTLEIIKMYTKKYPSLIKLVKDDFGNLKSAASFMMLLNHVDADYYMFCDQDDVWLKNKIQLSLNKLLEMESFFANKPCIVFTDLILVNEELAVINNSMWKYSDINPENAKNFYKTTCSSTITGCTMILNKALKDKVLPYPGAARMHDWWISLNAAHYGAVDYVDTPTILYRQHSSNVLGAEKKIKFKNFQKLLTIKKTLLDNIKVIKMLNKLNFKINYFKVFFVKIRTILLNNRI